jgi:hypothetical protein
MNNKDFPINCYTKDGIWLEEVTQYINQDRIQLQMKEVMKRLTYLKFAYGIELDLFNLKLPYEQLIIFLDELIKKEGENYGI